MNCPICNSCLDRFFHGIFDGYGYECCRPDHTFREGETYILVVSETPNKVIEIEKDLLSGETIIRYQDFSREIVDYKEQISEIDLSKEQMVEFIKNHCLLE